MAQTLLPERYITEMQAAIEQDESANFKSSDIIAKSRCVFSCRTYAEGEKAAYIHYKECPMVKELVRLTPLPDITVCPAAEFVLPGTLPCDTMRSGALMNMASYIQHFERHHLKKLFKSCIWKCTLCEIGFPTMFLYLSHATCVLN